MYPYVHDPATAVTLAAMLSDERIAAAQARAACRDQQRRAPRWSAVHRPLSARFTEGLAMPWRRPSRIEQT